MKQKDKEILTTIANTIRQFSIEAVQKANSGHPGLPLGCAEIGAYLYAMALQHNPKNPKWIGRDHFVLSAGHGSMLLYSVLHLAGFDLSLDEIKNFRQFHSKTPGHPEYGLTPGVEATTGPLGQGVGNAVGLALANKILAQKFNKEGFELFKNKIFCLASDGCIMEGVSSEASAFSGHLQLDNLILIYDANQITLDGPLADCSSEKTKERYKAYNWDVFEIDGYDLEKMQRLFNKLRKKQKRPTLIIAHTVIGKGSPHRAGSHKAHGQPLGAEELLLTKEALHLPKEEFFIPEEVKLFFQKRLKKQSLLEKKWLSNLAAWGEKYPDLYREFKQMEQKDINLVALEQELQQLNIKSPIASRESSSMILQYLSKKYPFIIGGSADLSSSDMTFLKDFSIINAKDFTGRNIKYGVREFAMGTITNGLALSQMFLPFCGTFLVFSDYMRSSIRLASLSSLQLIYQFTHDSIFLGEDGPTHQPIEHLASLRAMPSLQLIRPADSYETKMAFLAALQYKGPTALVLSRQALPLLDVTQRPFNEGLGRGAYIVKSGEAPLDFTLFASGSELALALDVAKALENLGKKVRVISFPSFFLFEKQSDSYKESIVGGNLGKRVSIEAGSSFGWHKYIGREGVTIAHDTFGESAPAKDLAKAFGFTVDSIVTKCLSTI